ncbi:MAG: protein kinase, partial [Actinomycetota bacterium]|nr:protein kinase [Actinomycetota bacterium]
MSSLKVGGKVGPWTLRRFLGGGGNADVWEAERDGEVVALKVLRTRKTDSEPFQRFRIETHVVEEWHPDGVVPIIESFLPDPLPPKERAWVAMPVARPIREALGASPTLDAVCEALVEVARSLAAMGVIAHRDIKPSNLHFFDGRYLIGDFGLVSYPGKEDLTASSQELGPRNYLAPEMIANPARADGRQADVYSLAKTLWALATAQDAPPPGHLRR